MRFATNATPMGARFSPLVWLNLVCLDAPLVAVSWQWLFAREFAVPVPRGATAALFLTAWMIYLADRLVDSCTLRPGAIVSARQSFCRQHRRWWVAAVAVIAVTDAILILGTLDRVAMSAGSAIGACAFVYLLVNQLRPQFWRVLPLKEISIGVIFAAGAMVGLLRSLPHSALLPWFAFAAVCALNCICIAVWERDLDEAQRRISIATAFPQATHVLLPVLVLLGLTSALFARQPVCVCVATSAALLAILHRFGGRIAPDSRTALADLVLLSPLLILASARL